MFDTIPPDVPERQCLSCLEIKPFSAFYAAKANDDGIEHVCKVCRKLIREKKILGARKSAVQERVLSGMKECNTCHRALPSTEEFFNRNRVMPDGFCYTCRDCRMAIRRVPEKPRTVPEGMKQCNTCQKILPATSEYFCRANNASDGLQGKCKECRHAYTQAWSHAKHPLKEWHIREDGMKRCSECKEWLPLTAEYFYRSSTADFGYLSRCKVCYLRDKKLHRRNNPEYYKAYEERHQERNLLNRQRYREKHREKLRASGRHYVSTHRDVARRNWNNRRARMASVAGNYTVTQIQEQLKRQKCKCYYAACGHAKFERRKDGTYIYHIEHTFPLSRVAGTDIPANDMSYLVLTCPDCNFKKHDRFPWEWPEGGRLL